ncbi:fatty-acid amide hydrolase 2-like [Notechis scutatus]|uniref:Fatty-acid amide hydrolase 2-like n=1 Tax=Notechis scutatus TaxID=8663 RepID=A0A6J1VZR2_9SAUR|nr:fatty-acid amide hydrolase 2-like [Notechis scutatus]
MIRFHCSSWLPFPSYSFFRLKLDDPVSLQNIKFYSMEHDGGSIFLLPVAKEILQVHRKVVAHLETDLGIEVESVAIRKMKYSFQIWSAMMSSKSSNNQENQTFTDLLGDHGKPVWPSWELVKWMMRLSSHTFPAIGKTPGQFLILVLCRFYFLKDLP